MNDKGSPRMPLPRRRLLAGTAALSLARIAQAAAAAEDGVLRFGLSTYPPNLLPWSNAGTAAGTVNLLHRRGLTSFGPDGKLRPELAARWERDGDTGWVFHLRDAVFHNGDKVSADDVKWTIEQIGAEKSVAYLRTEFQGAKQVDVIDPKTVRIVMKEPVATLPLWMANFCMPIIARSGPSDATAIGAGPYVLKGAERGVSLDFAPFDKFYKPGMPKLKALRLIAYADENARVAALHAGDVDLIEYVPWQSMQAIERDPKLALQTTEGPFMYLTFNGRTGPFTDARIRQAVACAVRRDDIVKAAFYGRGDALGGMPIAKGTEFYDPKLAAGWAYDPDKARQLLQQAGAADGFACTLLATATYSMHKTTAEIVQQGLAAIGIKVTLNLPDWATRVAAGNRGQFEFSVQGTAADSNDPDGLASIVDGGLSPSYTRSFDLAVPRLQELFAAGRREFDIARRHAIYTELQQVVLDEVPICGLAWRSQGYAMARPVHDFTNMPGALTFYSGTTLEDASMV